jgi:hypothetical protein
MMKIGLISILVLCGANAQSGTGTLGVTATMQGSLNLTFETDPSGMAVTGSTTSTASPPIGTVKIYSGTAPANVNKMMGSGYFSLSTPIDVRVDVANSASTGYTLTATLSEADVSLGWALGGNIIASGNSSVLTTTGVYATAVPYTLNLVAPASAAAGQTANSIGFTAVGN